MVNICIGIVIGAAFAPFWMKVYAWIAVYAKKFMKQEPPKE